MERIPPDIRLCMLEEAAKADLPSLLSLSSTNKGFQSLYKRHEQHLVSTFFNAFINQKNQIACRVLASYPTFVLSDECSEKCRYYGVSYVDVGVEHSKKHPPETDWRQLAIYSTIEPTKLISEMKRMIRIHALVKYIHRCIRADYGKTHNFPPLDLTATTEKDIHEILALNWAYSGFLIISAMSSSGNLPTFEIEEDCRADDIHQLLKAYLPDTEPVNPASELYRYWVSDRNIYYAGRLYPTIRTLDNLVGRPTMKGSSLRTNRKVDTKRVISSFPGMEMLRSCDLEILYKYCRLSDKAERERLYWHTIDRGHPEPVWPDYLINVRPKSDEDRFRIE